MTFNDFIKEEMQKDYFKNILEVVRQQEKKYLLSPENEYRYNSFLKIDINKIHTVIVSNSPFPYTYASDGLAFSSRSEETSYEMRRFKRLFEDFLEIRVENDKASWVKNGFMMLPRELTVINGKRRNENVWTPFTCNLVKFLINDKSKKRAFLFFDKMYDLLRMDIAKNKKDIFAAKINFKDKRQNYYELFLNDYVKFLKQNGIQLKLPKRGIYYE